MEEYAVGDLVLCTVTSIEKTIVHVKIEDKEEGTITFNEISPGRIRNIRDYVVPKKQIVCKILRIKNNHIELSFRRVTKKEKEEVLERERLEKSSENILKGVLKEQSKDIISKIKESSKIFDFLEDSIEDKKELESLVGKENSEKIIQTFIEKQKKEVKVVQEISLKSNAPDGISRIKKILDITDKNAKVSYVAASKYKITIISEDAKDAGNQMKKIIQEIETNAKENKAEFQELKRK